MDGSLAFILFVSIISLLISFFCSMAETCLYSVRQSHVETLVQKGNRGGRILARLRARIEESISAILIANTVANTVGASWIGALVVNRFGNYWLGLTSAIFTALVLFCSEITPKSLGVRYASTLAPMLAAPLQLLVWLLWPLVKLSGLVTRIWSRKKSLSHGTADDIVSLARLIQQQGDIHPHEVEWVRNALRLDEVTAFDLMTPNPVVARVPKEMRLKDTQFNADHWRFSRLPVCLSANPDEIVGIVHRRKVFDALARDEFHLSMGDLMEKPEFVDEGIPAHELLDQFLKKRRHLFCVRDGSGNFSGVVTLEDVLECLLGREIVDETDLHEDMQALALRRKSALLSRKK